MSEIQQNFTLSVWLRPDVVAMSGRSYVLYPESGEKLYGAGHATSGFTVGQDGVRVFEQSGEKSQQVLYAPFKIEGWSLVSIVYCNGIPTVFVNGKKAGEGARSSFIVHPTDNELSAADPVVTLFQGERLSLAIQNKALPAKEVEQVFKEGKPENRFYIVNNHKWVPAEEEIIDLHAPWQITLPLKDGKTKQMTAKSLKSLHSYADEEVKYFSGTAVYSRAMTLPPASGQKVLLDLGNVAFFAEVYVNDKYVATLWKSPYVADITGYVQEGTNSLTVKVTNLWTNRLIGDEQYAPENDYDRWGEIDKFPAWYANNEPYKGKRNTFVSWQQYDKNGPLTESGLIGPVRIVCMAGNRKTTAEQFPAIVRNAFLIH